jgi:emericellamide synthase (highly reducing iterative type I polyketide synthase)
MTIDQWSNTLRPKVDGSWNLHAALPADLDFFVMLSSAVAIRGNPGQCHYGAACAFQDALAHHRSASGLPAHSINIAAVSEIGFVSENPEVAAALRRNGLGNVTQGELLSHLDYVVSHASDRSCCQSSIGLFPPDDKLDPRLSATLATCYMDSKFRHLAPQDAAATAGQTLARPEADALNSIASATTMEEAIGHVEEAILQQLSKLIMTPRERLVSSASLDEYGVDSLVAVELKNWLSACLRANVPMLSIRSSSSIHALAGTVASQSRLVAV